MPLPDTDITYLRDRDLQHEITEESGMTCVVFPSFKLPAGLDHESADLLIRLPAGYPDLAPDMWWFDPGLRTRDGNVIQATESIESHLGRTWQRWSRHFQPGQWQSGIDGLESFMALINRELLKSVPEAA
jgi:hypothetical protein